jgi:signal peptidase I
MITFVLICCSCLLLLLLALVLTRTCLLVITVINQSMVPTLEAGDRVLVLRKHLIPRLRKGQIVVVTPLMKQKGTPKARGRPST